MKRTGKVFLLLILFALSMFILSCTTVSVRYRTEERYSLRGRHTLRNSRAVLSVRVSPEGNSTGSLTSPYIPGITLNGDIEETATGFRLYITEVLLFAEWPNGWTEARYEGTGSFLFEREQDAWLFRIQDSLELWEIVSGEIRYYDTYFRGDNGLWKVRNRVDRIQEISRFLKEDRGFPPFYDRFLQRPKKGIHFSADIVPFLFPEAKSTFSLKEKRWIYSGSVPDPAAGSKEKVTGSGIFWRPAYSREILPAHLIPLRDSGTLWRDYEEAGTLLYAFYNLEYVLNSLLPGSLFEEIR